MLPILQAVAGLLERAEILEIEATVRGLLGEQTVTFALKKEDHGSWMAQWTEARVAAPEGLLVELRPATDVERRRAAKGPAVGQRPGNPQFDAAFIVAGAPERLVRRLLDDSEIRRSLLTLESGEPSGWLRAYDGVAAHRPGGALSGRSTLVTTQGPEDAQNTAAPRDFVVQISGWADVERATLLVQTAARLGSIGAAIVRLERAQGAAGYRGQPASGARTRDEEEIRELNLKITKKRAATERLGCLVGGVVVLMLLGIALFLLWLALGGAQETGAPAPRSSALPGSAAPLGVSPDPALYPNRAA